jgi:hypothetical protein
MASEKVEWIGIGIGADAVPSLFLPVGKLKSSYENKDYTPEEHRGKLNTKFVSKKIFSSVKLDLSGDMRLDGLLEYLLYLGLGAKATAQQGATAAYQHTITEDPLQSRPKCTLWKGYTAADSTPQKFANALLETLGIDIKSQGEGSLTATFKADTVDIDTSAQTPTYASDPVPHTFNEMDYRVEDFGTTPVADTSITEFSMDLKNEITELQTANQSIFPSVRQCTGYEVSGKAAQQFENLNLLKEWLGGLSQTSMGSDYVWKNSQVSFTGPLIESTYYYRTILTFPYWKLTDYSDPEGDILQYNYGWEAYEKGETPGTDDMLMKAVLTSKLTAIA